jgi:mannose-6-phosphate isomerase-like protein (cupin superfamily)
MEKTVSGNVVRIGREEYQDSLAGMRHLFLVGDLKRPTPAPFIRDQHLEMVYCEYQAGDVEAFHWHSVVTEYEFVIEGKLSIIEVDSSQEHILSTGDMFAIPPNACVCRAFLQPTRTMTIKVPSCSDKINCPLCERDCSFRMVVLNPIAMEMSNK